MAVRPAAVRAARVNARPPRARAHPSFAFALTLALVLFTALAATLPNCLATAPRLANVLPAGGSQGSEIEVVFSGQRLGDTREILFYRDGLSVVRFEPATNQVKVRLKIDAACPRGEHPVRLRTDSGLSEIRTFWIGSLTNLHEVEPNSERAKAQRVPLNCTVHGTIPSEDQDFFVVTAEKGQRVSVEIEGLRLGRAAFDPYLAVHDAAGKNLAASDDSSLGLQDGMLSLIAPASGDYTILVRESGYGGQEGNFYRLHLGSFPRPTAVAPLVVPAGQKSRIRFIGDAHGDWEQDVTPAAGPVDKVAVFAVAPGASPPSAATNTPAGPARPGGMSGTSVAPTPNWIRTTAFPVAAEQEPNDTRAEAAPPQEAPVVFNGILGRPGDHDWFRFRARKGQNLQVSVIARRLRSPLDSALQIVSTKGAVLADNDDASGPDSSINFKPDDDGEFAVLVRDHLRRGGPDFVYAIEVAPVAPSLVIKFPEVARNDTQSRQYIAAPRGNRFATVVSVRRTAAPGDLSIVADGLPPGLRLLTTVMPAKVDQFPVVFEAAADAPLGGRLCDLVLRATNGVTGHFQNDIELVQGPNNTSYYNTRVDRLAAAVTTNAPFQIRIVEPSVPIVQGGSMELQIVAERAEGFAEPINVQLPWRPPGISALPDMTIGKGSNRVTYVLNAKGDADLHSWPLVVAASAKVQDGDLFVASPPARLEVAEPYLTATIEKSGCEPGQSTNIVVKLDQKAPFEGTASIRLLGLSDKISVPEQFITATNQEVRFKVKVAPDCPPGSQRNLFCAIQIPKGGSVIPHQAGQGGSFRVLPPRAPVAGNDSKKVATR